MIWYTYRLDSLFTRLLDNEMAVHEIVDTLETDLANQKGFVSYYFIDGDPRWLDQLEQYHQHFKKHLKTIREYPLSESDKKAIDQIETEYTKYIKRKYELIALYEAGEKEAGAKLHQGVRDLFFKILNLCEDYRNNHFERVNMARKTSRVQAKYLRIIAGMAMSMAFILSIILTGMMMTQILGPVRKLSLEIDRSRSREKTADEVVTLKNQVHGLIQDMEKFSLVGKLAAGVAHSIRNPLTSVKMRLFSMERSLELSPAQKADFDVISEEIRHINNIVQNFLDYSRPPRLKMQKISPSDVVDDSIRLLQDRLNAYNVEIKLMRQKRLPEILADPEQLKEVLVNLILNACEAMGSGGAIKIQEEVLVREQPGRLAVIRVSDEGPGIPASIQEKIFQPFFTCKEDGTGLRLTIAERIVNEHGGWIDLKSREGEGTAFIINLPLKKGKNEHDSDH